MIHTHENADQENPAFRKLEELKYPLREHDRLVVPVFLEDILSLAIQCQEKSSKDKKKSFTIIDETIIKILITNIKSKLNSI